MFRDIIYVYRIAKENNSFVSAVQYSLISAKAPFPSLICNSESRKARKFAHFVTTLVLLLLIFIDKYVIYINFNVYTIYLNHLQIFVVGCLFYGDHFINFSLR
jgi:hypothetical protein